jgi:O-6-methylguanine DNA methyltransferase
MIQVYAQNINGTWFSLACAEQQVFGTSFGETEQKAIGNLLNNLLFNIPFQVFLAPSAYAKDTFALLENIFEGKDVNLNLNLAVNNLPEYTKRVIKATMQIPVGYVASYGSVAKAVGGGPRAVGNVMAGNCFAPIVPCHRVVKSDFTLGGYGGGLKVKYQLLTNEKRAYPSSIEIRLDDGAMQIYPVELALKDARFDLFT